ncbi:MAG: transcription termination factor Rho [Akkermansiaceae bacterium]|nr:transcription termination factor Rho [Akkermansiaceae bacterium]
MMRVGEYARMRGVKVIVVTGGIASGKSTVVEMLQEMGGAGVELFDCDAAVAELQQSGKLSRDLVTAFGAEALCDNGSVNKDYLRGIVQNDPEGRDKLNNLIHPKLAQMCLDAQAEARRRGDVHTFLVDIPLYFESPVEFGADIVCVVAVTPETQIARMASRDGFDRPQAEAMLAAQMPTQEKIDRAGLVFWNEGSPGQLRSQVELFYNTELAAEAKAMHARSVVIDLNELRALPLNELQRIATTTARRGTDTLPRPQLVAELARTYLAEGSQVVLSGVLEFGKDNMVFLRDAARSFRPGDDDPRLTQDLIRKHELRPGNVVKVKLRPAQGKNERNLTVGEVLEIEGTPVAEYTQPKPFDKLTPLIPTERLILENPDIKSPAMRVLDLITPLGMGQRALVVAPPRGGKTVLLKTMAKSLRANYPKADLLVLLLDERPEEVTDFEDTVDVPVYASTFDEPSRRHAQLSDLLLERARRLVEQGHDVIIMLDSLTRLARGYNANQSGGRTMSGGLGSNALEKPRKFFGAARKVEEGGSLTIIATCLIETESRMDEIIFEEFKGTGNMEIRLDRELSERRIYPAISIPQSGTRNDDRLYHPDELLRVLQVRRQLATLPGWEGLQTLLKNIEHTQNNLEILLKGLTISTR